jgi:hypothetical protein
MQNFLIDGALSDDALQMCWPDQYTLSWGIFPQSPQDHTGNLNASGGLANAIVKDVIADGHDEIILSGPWVTLVKVWVRKNQGKWTSQSTQLVDMVFSW